MNNQLNSLIEWLNAFPKRDAYGTVDESGLVAERALQEINQLLHIIKLRDDELKAKDLLIEYWYNKANNIDVLKPKLNIDMNNMELDLEFLESLTNPNNKNNINLK